MAFLTSSYAVSIFPQETFVRHKAYACRRLLGPDRDVSWDWVKGYFAQNYNLVNTPLMRLTTVLPWEVSTSTRCISGSESWVIKSSQGMYMCNPLPLQHSNSGDRNSHLNN